MRVIQIVCPHCQNDDPTMMERVPIQMPTYVCKVCAKEFTTKGGKS